MSNLKTIFLTPDNEHCYFDYTEKVSSPSNSDEEGYPVILEMSKQNISIELNDEEDLVILIKPGTVLYEIFRNIKAPTGLK